MNNDSSAAPMTTLAEYGAFIGTSVYILYCVILSALAIESAASNGKSLILLQSLNFVLYFGTWLTLFLLSGSFYSSGVTQYIREDMPNFFAYAFFSVGIYILGILLQHLMGVLKLRRF